MPPQCDRGGLGGRAEWRGAHVSQGAKILIPVAGRRAGGRSQGKMRGEHSARGRSEGEAEGWALLIRVRLHNFQCIFLFTTVLNKKEEEKIA